MYFFNIRALLTDLARGPLPPGDAALYLFMVIGLAVPVWYPAPSATLDSFFDVSGTAHFFATFVIAIAGVRKSYLANGGPNGVNFSERFISLAWVVGLRLFLCLSLPFLIAALVSTRVEHEDLFSVLFPLFFLASQILYYWRISVHLRELAGRTAGSAQQGAAS